MTDDIEEFEDLLLDVWEPPDPALEGVSASVEAALSDSESGQLSEYDVSLITSEVKDFIERGDDDIGIIHDRCTRCDAEISRQAIMAKQALSVWSQHGAAVDTLCRECLDTIRDGRTL